MSDDEYEYTDEDFADLIQEITSLTDPLGLYFKAAMVEASVDLEGTSPQEALAEGEEIFLRALFTIGDVAWSDRVLYPEKHKEAREFELVAPTESEIMLAKIREEAKSGALFDLDDDDEDED